MARKREESSNLLLFAVKDDRQEGQSFLHIAGKRKEIKQNQSGLSFQNFRVMGEDRSWMYFSIWVPEFENGLFNFLNISFAKASLGGQIKCPCRRCKNRYLYRRDEVYNHVKSEGFVENYDLWIFHGEDPSSLKTARDLDNDVPRMRDNIDELLHDRFRDVIEETSNVQQGPNEEAKKFYRLVEEGKQELYPGCKNFSKLSFIIRLFIYKTLHGLSNAALNDLLQLLREMIPDAKLPPNFNEARNILRNLGLDCQKIYACPNDCMLFWKEHENDNECHTCHASKWKQSQEKDGKKPNNEADKILSNIPAKVLWYFPLKSRLQRLFMCAESAKYMTWHDRGRPKDGNLRHPADGKAWKEFDMLYPDFAKEPRNVRLGLASDGFNPFRTMSIAHSTWPVVLVNYNLPPWMCMKPEYFILSLLIPGPESPGNNIDVYLQPLVDELNELWNDGLETYDKLKNETFQMYAALTWTINDFPAYSMLSGWKTKGKFACPLCNYETSSLYLNHSRKTCYMDHRRFLDLDHPWRRNKSSFNGHTEDRPPPTPLSGVEALRDLSSFKNEFGKTQKKKNDATCPWKKKSIFFELPYWQFNLCRHNLDMMHIEKNICDSLIGTLLDVAGKSKDHAKARFDLIELGVKEKLQPELSLDGEHVVLQKACYAMSRIEKDIFCRAIKGVKLPYGCASNIASKVVKPEDLDQLEIEIVEILCELEKIFLPAFFDIIVHLPIHLVNEVRLGGPVQYRWMFSIERYLGKLKSYVQNRRYVEGSIAEGYLIEECANFCSRYMDECVKTRLNKGAQDSDMSCVYSNESNSVVFKNAGHPLGGKKRRKGKLFTLDPVCGEQAHRYALFNSDCKELDDYISEHQLHINRQPGRSRWARAQNHSNQFTNWLREKVINHSVSDHIFLLAKGPCPTARRFTGYYVNGYRLYTKLHDTKCKTQNSGVSVIASTSSFASSRDKNPVVGDVDYFGAIIEIMELNYWSKSKVVLLRCEWYQVEKDDYGLPCINMKKLCSLNDPYVMPSQVHQVFYVPDPLVDDLQYVMNRVPRDLYEGDYGINDGNTYWSELHDNDVYPISQVGVEDIQLSREDIRPIIIGVNTNLEDIDGDDDNDDDSIDETLWDSMNADEEQEADND
ncbi:uncharacterized protein LOC122043920 [Zingiber officinale]|uniref:uncharacterized protein LOC122043920 n=1 Tax=Zingiber officinale TaxID=94328 RepID=UPI001C4D64F2|nr:uncharacterized protein LOC122043920 [Zingiber officinale]